MFTSYIRRQENEKKNGSDKILPSLRSIIFKLPSTRVNIDIFIKYLFISVVRINLFESPKENVN